MSMVAFGIFLSPINALERTILALTIKEIRSDDANNDNDATESSALFCDNSHIDIAIEHPKTAACLNL